MEKVKAIYNCGSWWTFSYRGMLECKADGAELLLFMQKRGGYK
jgi:hypothetical protein